MSDDRPKPPLSNEELARQYEEVCRLREALKRLLACPDCGMRMITEISPAGSASFLCLRCGHTEPGAVA